MKSAVLIVADISDRLNVQPAVLLEVQVCLPTVVQPAGMRVRAVLK
jgi:hypothetical protein